MSLFLILKVFIFASQEYNVNTELHDSSSSKSFMKYGLIPFCQTLLDSGKDNPAYTELKNMDNSC